MIIERRFTLHAGLCASKDISVSCISCSCASFLRFPIQVTRFDIDESNNQKSISMKTIKIFACETNPSDHKTDKSSNRSGIKVDILTRKKRNHLTYSHTLSWTSQGHYDSFRRLDKSFSLIIESSISLNIS